LIEIFQTPELSLVQGHDHFAAQVIGDAMLIAETQQLLLPGDAEPRLKRAWFVVDTGMDHAAIVPGLVHGEAILLLKDRQPEVWILLEQLERRGQADDAAADDRDVIVPLSHGEPPLDRGPFPHGPPYIDAAVTWFPPSMCLGVWWARAWQT